MSRIKLDTIESADSNSVFQFICRMPKIELHLHMEGAIRPELLLRISERNKIKLPFKTVAEFEALLIYKNFKDFTHLFLLSQHCLQTAHDFYEVIIDIGEQLKQHNVLYAEISWVPQFYFQRKSSIDEILYAMNEARAYVKEIFSIEMRWIFGLARGVPQAAFAAAQWVLSKNFDALGFVALGLGGDENSCDLEIYKELFEYANNNGLPANPHSGETSGPDNIRKTIALLKPNRIGHGVRAVEDSQLLEYLSKTGVMLEVCPTSNVKLGIYPSYAKHPLKKLVESGCKICINSDDPILFKTNLTEEYWHAVNDCGISLKTIVNSVSDALTASYLPLNNKLILQNKIDLWMQDFSISNSI